MTKRRTKKQKIKAKHPFLINWEADQNEPKDNLVKGQIKNKLASRTVKTKSQKNANSWEKDASLASVKHDIIKSLILVSLILGFELVLYLAWNT